MRANHSPDDISGTYHQARTSPQSIAGIAEDAQIFVYQKLALANLTIQTPWSNLTSKTSPEVDDALDVHFGEDFWTIVGFDLPKYLHAQRVHFHYMDLSQDISPAPAPRVITGTVRRLTPMGDHEPTRAEKDNYVPERCAPYDLVIHEDPFEEFTPIINIGPVYPDHE